MNGFNSIKSFIFSTLGGIFFYFSFAKPDFQFPDAMIIAILCLILAEIYSLQQK